MVVQKNDQDDSIKEILNELYQNIDDTFLSYFISLTAPKEWRVHLEKYERDYREDFEKARVNSRSI
ncbi:MAG: hypothetical protein ACHQUC_00600 [Chlamydiales bacterium]